MAIYTLNDLLRDQLRGLDDACRQFNEILPSLVARARHSELAQEFRRLDKQVADHVFSLAEACRILGVAPEGVRSEGMAGLAREARQTAREPGDDMVIDAALIASAQRLLHYLIAGYGTALAFAQCLEESEVRAILDRLLDEAWTADESLTDIARGGWFRQGVNALARNQKEAAA